ncbi:transcription termination/antitermination protein NusG [Paludibaculum fermentans]|uniref:transcription termination/antitermination protein NusG n=1 Tax=Paludibaculum fermentans TaxID=1473598 RepID=UPI003EB6EA51
MTPPSDQESSPALGSYPWFAVRVRSNREHTVSLQLRERGFEQFSPSYKVDHQWSDRKKVTEKFLFPGYVFCRVNPNDRLPLLIVPGVVDLISFGHTPAPIPDIEIERVRMMVRSGLPVAPWPYLQLGDRVLIERGPLAGLEGILQRTKGKYRLVVSLNLLQRSVSAEVERDWIRPIPHSLSQNPDGAGH